MADDEDVSVQVKLRDLLRMHAITECFWGDSVIHKEALYQYIPFTFTVVISFWKCLRVQESSILFYRVVHKPAVKGFFNPCITGICTAGLQLWVSTGASTVRSLLQSSGWCHHRSRRSVPPVMLTIRSSTSPCAPTTQPPDCLSSPRVLLTSDSVYAEGTAAQSGQQKHWWSAATASRGLSRVNSVCSQRQSACGLWNESTRSLSWQAPCLRQARSAVVWSCNYRIQSICHIRHLPMTDLAQTLACNLVLSRLDYCNAVLHGTTTGNIDKLQHVENSAVWSHTSWLVDVQSLHHLDTVIPQPTHKSSRHPAHPTLVLYNRTVWTILQHSLRQVSSAQLWPPGTLSHVLLLTATHLELELLNLVWKHFCSAMHSTNCDISCQHLWNYDRMAL